MSAFDEHSPDFASPADHGPFAEPDGPARAGGADPVFDLARLAECLPTLGTVLWLDRRLAAPATKRQLPRPRGLVLLDHPAVASLSRCTSGCSRTAVTPLGPRESISFRDASGDVLAKLFLLPDTDYFAWDRMLASSGFTAASDTPTRWSAHGAFLRTAIARIGSSWKARLLTFEQRRLPWIRTLDARPPLRISLIGLEIARAIAHDEGTDLVSPLHTA